MCTPMMPRVTTPRIPMPTTTATTIRTILRPLPPPVGGLAGTAVTAVATGPAATAVPHLLQSFVPGVRTAPQELQNAISHLVEGDDSSDARVYRRMPGLS